MPFDALEFDETMATVDLGYDLAFLLMDLERRMDRSAANRVLNRYLARSGDVGLLQGLPAFLSMRAMIRAHVEARIGRAEVAGAYLGLAMTCLAPVPPVVVAVGGLPGSGKSTLARAIAPALGVAPGAVILRSDEYRKRRCGVAPYQRLPPAAYEPEVTEMVLADLIRDAALATSAGHAVIADATFMDPAHRAALAAAVRSCGTSFHGFWLQAPLKLLEDRIAGRHGDASDATVDVLRRTAAHDPGPGLWNPVDATDLPGAVERLLAQFSSPAASAPAPIRGASGEGES